MSTNSSSREDHATVRSGSRILTALSDRNRRRTEHRESVLSEQMEYWRDRTLRRHANEPCNCLAKFVPHGGAAMALGFYHN
jgi:hypothetical protein